MNKDFGIINIHLRTIILPKYKDTINVQIPQVYIKWKYIKAPKSYKYNQIKQQNEQNNEFVYYVF